MYKLKRVFFSGGYFPYLKVAGDPLPLVTGESAAELVLDLGGREGGAPGRGEGVSKKGAPW